jgi:hypothetical protein
MDDINFYDQFRQHSTTDLLRISLQPDHYQPEAVSAADRLLKERGISSTERQQVEQALREEASVPDRFTTYKEKIADAVQPMIAPSSDYPAQWFTFFKWAFAAYCVYNYYLFVKTCIVFWRCPSCEGIGSLIYEIFYIAYLTITFFLLAKRRRWGWILLFTATVPFVLLDGYIIIASYKYRELGVFNPAYSLPAILIRVALVTFLWRTRTGEFFAVDDRTKRQAAIAGVVIGAALLVVFH